MWKALWFSVPLALISSACTPQEERATELASSSPEEIGEYLTTIGGCHDCHTDGYMENGGEVPESNWLAGSALGFRGPWGTTYPQNLRLTVQSMSEDAWVEMLRTRNTLPPMPWMNINRMREDDMRAIYQYLASLGPIGEQPPSPVPPDQEPETPYIVLSPPQGLPE